MKCPTVERVRQAFDYVSGRLIWRISTNRRIRPGREAGKSSNGYVQVRLDGVLMSAHRVVWAICTGEWPPSGMDIDHINMNRSDNRIENLRLATRSQNKYNTVKQRDNTSGHKGVDFDRSRGLWRARISVDGRVIQIGRFASAEAAGAAYMVAARTHHGEFARTAG